MSNQTLVNFLYFVELEMIDRFRNLFGRKSEKKASGILLSVVCI